MKFRSNAIPHLFKSSPGQGIEEKGDSTLTVPPVLVPVVEAPFPIFNVFSNANLTAPIIGSFALSQQLVMNVTTSVVICKLPFGLWHLDIVHRVIPRGAVSDLTAEDTLLLEIINSGVTLFSILSNVVASITVPQHIRREFYVNASKENDVDIREQRAAGAGTSSAQSFVSIIGTRLL